jgi:zinc/manganese transport system permease protein
MNPLGAVAHVWQQEFTRRALLAGTPIAAAAGLAGYFLVLRSQVFSADALGHIAFTGALIALAAGVDARAGLYVAAIGGSVLLGALGRRGRADDVVVGSALAWVLGIGVLALSVFTTRQSGGDATAGVRVLFGSIYALDATATRLAVISGGAAIAVMVATARPLLFASVDESVAAARGLPVRLVGYVFLVVVGATAAQAAQAVGALLLLGLLAAPPAAAMRMTTRPYRAMALASTIAVAALWSGISLSYAVPRIPPSTAVVAMATAAYALSCLPITRGGRRHLHVRARPA